MRTQRQPAGSAVSAVSAFRRLPIALAVAGALSQGALAATITVTSNLASGPGTLQQAILDANAACATDLTPVIQFSGPFTINQSSPLPQFFCGAPGAYKPTIDGLTGTGATPNTDATGWNASLKVVIDGTNNMLGYACTLDHADFGGYGGFLTVKGIEVNNFNYGSNEHAICGRVMVSGSAFRNDYSGIKANSGSTVGGDTPADRNFFPGYRAIAIEIDGNTAVKNNLIGVDYDGIPYAAAGNYGIYFSCCTQPAGVISGNTIVATTKDIYLQYDNGMLIAGNRLNMKPDGSSFMGVGGTGIYLYYSYGATIRDNTIGGVGTGILNTSAYPYGTGVLIDANKIGTDAAGTTATNSVGTGIRDDFSIGTRITGNVISGTSKAAAYLYSSTGARIAGNFLGTDLGGGSLLGNSGVNIYAESSNGLDVDDNTIAGGYNSGISLFFATGANIRNNRIGTNISKNATMGNGVGMSLECSDNLTVTNNFVAASRGEGIALLGTQNSVFQQNVVGQTFPNGGHGVLASWTYCGSRTAVVLGRSVTYGVDNYSDDNQFIGNGNVIANNLGHGVFIDAGNGNSLFQAQVWGNSGDGVRIEQRTHNDLVYGTVIDSAATGNSIIESVIYGNGGKNINLGFDGGPRPNDMGDTDGGPNNGQNYPEVTDAVFDSLNNWTTIAFKFDTFAPGNYRVDFFANAMPGAPAGQTYLGNTFIAVPGTGTTGTYSVNGHWNNISAIATRQVPLDTFPATYGLTDSSEFSPQAPGTTLPVPGVNVVPTSINFGDIVVGRSSGSSTVTVQSTGTAPYVVSTLREGSCTGPAICTSGAFACSTTCADGSSWNAGQQCTITASFNPTALGPQSKTLALCDNATGSPRTISFTGNGIAPPVVDISYSPSSWSFGEVLVGAQSASRTFLLTNSGPDTVYLGSPSTSGDFSITGNSCTATLAGGASCTTDVAFAPSARGGVNGSLQITGSNTAPAAAAAARTKVTASPITAVASALLQGSGVQVGQLSLPASLPFGTLILHGAPQQQGLDLRNSGNGPLAISSIGVTGPFTMTNTCGTSLAVGASCTITLTFTPAALGTANGTLNVVTDAPGGSRAIALSANVVADARPVVRINPTQLGFGDLQIGAESPSQAVTITNEGAQVAVLGPITITQPENSGTVNGKSEFSVSATTCGATLEPQASCVAKLVFRAMGLGTRVGELFVPSNSADSPQKATITGTGCRPYAAGANRDTRHPC